LVNAPLIQGTACQKDHAASRRPIAYLYSRENEAEARQVKVLTADEARRIGINITRLPELLATERQQSWAAQRPLVSTQSSGLIHPLAGPGSTGTPRCTMTAAGSKQGIGSVTGDMLAGSVLIHWLARAKAAVTVSGYIAKARPSPRAAARRRIHSAWALPVFAASDMVCSRRILGGILRVGR
jgi:hypothetical protein